MTSTQEDLRETLWGLKSTTQAGPDQVNKEMIRHWCEAMEDANPLYTDVKYATENRYGSIIAPPQMVQTWTFAPLWPDGQELHFRHPETLSAREPLLSELVYAALHEAGYVGTMAVGTTMEFLKQLIPGDRVTRIMKLVNVTLEKKTQVGVGHFVTFGFTDTNQKGEIICQQTMTLFKYKPVQQ